MATGTSASGLLAQPLLVKIYNRPKMGKLGQTTNTSRTRSAGGDVNSVALRTKILKILKCGGDVAEMVSDFFIRVFIQAVLCDS